MRVMTYNVLNGGQNRESYILEIIQSVNPDVVILQEVYAEDFLKFLSDALGMVYRIGKGNRKRKVALLSRLPIRSFKSYHPFPPISRNFIDAEIECEPNKIIKIIGIHPIANLWVGFELWRLWEAKYILKFYRKYEGLPCVIAGDFNAVAPMDNIRIEIMPAWLKWIIYLQGNRVYRFSIQAYLSTGLTDCFRELNPANNGFTLPPPNPNTRLDYIFANALLKTHLEKCAVIYEPNIVNRASDHCPVIAEFNLAD